jgi:competence protein ComEC
MQDHDGIHRPRAAFPGLLSWQIQLLFLVLGLLASRFLWPAACSACLLYFSCSRLDVQGLRGPAAFLSFLAGWAVAVCLLAGAPLPEERERIPSWIEERREVELEASVKRVDYKPENRLRIILTDAVCRLQNGSSASLGTNVVWTWRDPRLQPVRGQRVRGRFRLKPVRGFANPGAWDVGFYWAMRGVGYRTYTQGGEERVALSGEPGLGAIARRAIRSGVLDRTPSGPGQGLLLALLLGDQSRLDYDTLDLVRRASLAHSLALSGLHLGFMIGLGWMLARLLGRAAPSLLLVLPRAKLAVLLAAPLVVAYLWMGQFRPSLVRASLMFFFWGVLLLHGRRKIWLDGLFFALLVILFASPLAVFDLGLQLSVVAVAGIILVWPLCYERLQAAISARGRRYLLPPACVLGISAVANAALLPLMASNFGQVSPHIYLNLVWIPALGLVVMPLGLLGAGLGCLPGLDTVSGWLLQASAHTLEHMVGLLQAQDGFGWLETLVSLRPKWPEAAGYWLLLLAASLGLAAKARIQRSLLFLGLALLLLPHLGKELGALQDRAALSLIDVGQGQAVLVETPGGRRTLIDGGGSWNRDFDVGRFALAPALTRGEPPRVDTVVLSHQDFDHLRGLYYILRHFAVNRFCYNGLWPTGWDGATLRSILRERGIPVHSLRQGDELRLGRGYALRVLHPKDPGKWSRFNNGSLCLRLERRGRGLALIPGDLQIKGLEALLAGSAPLRADALIVPHHGSRTSCLEAFYSRAEPKVAAASCGYLNHFRFPHEEVRRALQAKGLKLFTTGEHGLVRMSWSDGGKAMRIDPFYGETKRFD